MKKWSEFEEDNWRFAVEFIRLTQIDEWRHDLPLDFHRRLVEMDADWRARTAKYPPTHPSYGIFGIVVPAEQKWATSLALRQFNEGMMAEVVYTCVSWWNDRVMVCSEAAFEQMLPFAFSEEIARGTPVLHI